MVSASPSTSKQNRKLIARGISGVIEQISESMVVKHAFSTSDEPAIALEKKIYERLGMHPSITRFYPRDDGALQLEFLHCTLKDRVTRLSPNERFLSKDLFRWTRQMSQGLAHIHSCGVIYVDIGCQNVLVDWSDNVKLCDFAGSSIDGSTPQYYPSNRFTSPKISIPSVSADLFAFGSLLYEMETTQPPYHDKSESDVQKLFSDKQFPDTKDCVLGKIIENCWNSTYKSAFEVVEELNSLEMNKHSDSMAMRGVYICLFLVCLSSLVWVGL